MGQSRRSLHRTLLACLSTHQHSGMAERRRLGWGTDQKPKPKTEGNRAGRENRHREETSEQGTVWRKACEGCREEVSRGSPTETQLRQTHRPRARTLRPPAFFLPADLPHSARRECVECDELIRTELPLHLAQEPLAHQALPTS